MSKTFIKNSLAVAVGLASAMAVAEQAPDSKKTNSLDAVVVTGQKIERSLQDTKESVAVFTGEDLEARNLTELTDVFQQTPGVTGTQAGFRIRGVRSSDGASLPNRGDLASVVVDGVTTSGWVKSEAVGQLWDVSQVEILRGPQSTNLGRNALAGAIVVNTNDPTYENEAKIRIGAGNYGSSEYKGMANMVLVDGVSAIRIAAETSETDGYIDNVTRDEDDYGGQENSVYRLKWLLEPTDDLRMVLSYQRLENEYGDSRTILGDYDLEDRASTNDEDAVFETEADLFSLNIDVDLNSEVTIKSISAYQDGERYRLSDADQTAAAYGTGGGYVTRSNNDTNWSQEFRINYDSGNVRSSTGVFYTEIEADYYGERFYDINLVSQFNAYAESQGIPLPLGELLTNPLDLSQFLGPGAPVLPAFYEQYYGIEQSGTTVVETTSWAIFTEWEFDFQKDWTASFGARYDEEEQTYETVSTNTTRSSLPSPLGAPFGTNPVPGVGVALDDVINLANGVLQSNAADVPRTKTSNDFDNILPHAGITYRVNEDVSTSFFVKKSYRSGGSELTLLSGINEFDEEELWNYELSLRSVVLDGQGVFNANVYYADWTDQQVGINEPGTANGIYTITVNAGKSKLYGAEFSFDYYVDEAIKLYVGAAVNRTEYVDFESPDGEEDYSGNEFKFAPKVTAVTGVNYNGDDGLFMNAAVNYAGTSYSDVANENKMSSRTLLDLSGGYTLDDLKLELFVKNAFDKTYETDNSLQASDDVGTLVVRLGAPRLTGVRATYTF